MTDSIAISEDHVIRIALVGCGRISRNHIKSFIVHHKRVDLVALCDVNKAQLDEIDDFISQSSHELQNSQSKIFSPIHFLSYTDLIEAVKSNELKVDLVVLTTPSGHHPSQAILAAEHGIHVCTEKPMATRWEDGLKMVKACEDAGVKLFVVKQNRLNSTLQLVKRQLAARRFGQLSMISVNVFWQRPQSYYDLSAWRGTWDLDGGALMNQASHYVDLLHWLVGPVESLSASISTTGRNIEAEDTAALQLKWKNGALGTMSVTMLTYPKNLEGSITILGETGTVKIGGPAVNKIECWDFADEQPDDDLVEQASYETTSVYGFGHPAYYSNVIDVLQGKSEPLCDGREGLKSLELIIAAYQSAKKHIIVDLPLQN